MSSSYLHVHVHYEKVGEAFDAIRARDDVMRWAGCAARFTEGVACMGINPLKSISRDYLERYLEKGIKGRGRWDRWYGQSVSPPRYESVYMVLDGEHEEFATELALRFGNGLVRRSGLAQL